MTTSKTLKSKTLSHLLVLDRVVSLIGDHTPVDIDRNLPCLKEPLDSEREQKLWGVPQVDDREREKKWGKGSGKRRKRLDYYLSARLSRQKC